MSEPKDKNTNWFEQGGQNYALYRPTYPQELIAFLSSCALNHKLAVDVGCGTGQLTTKLADVFENVIGVDPSNDQIDHATAYKNVEYRYSPAERLALEDDSVDLITAAQAAHWFDLPLFYDEVRRVLHKEGVLALISYGVLKLPSVLQTRFETFYYDDIGSYWPKQRRLVDEGYQTINFPFDEIKAPQMAIKLEWNFQDFLGYLTTWSAVHAAKKDSKEGLLIAFAGDMAKLWGDPSQTKMIEWPINIRIGKLS